MKRSLLLALILLIFYGHFAPVGFHNTELGR